jgi:hypothetical protein
MPSEHPKVFISYSHDSPEHERRVWALADRLRKHGVDAQFDRYVAGTPPEGWPRWMLDRLDWADFVLVICTETYYRRFRGHEVGSTGKGADWEGNLITVELYNSKSRTTRFSPVLFDPEDERFIPEPIRGHTYYLLNSEGNFVKLYAFLTDQSGVLQGDLGPIQTLARERIEPLQFDDLRAVREKPDHNLAVDGWPSVPRLQDWQPADCESVREAFVKLLTTNNPQRVLLIRGPSGTGKSHLTRYLFGVASHCEGLCCGRFDLKSGADLDCEFTCFLHSLKVEYVASAVVGQAPRARLDAVLSALRRQGRPTLLIFDTFEQGGEWARWVEEHALLAALQANWLRMVIAGQRVPNSACAAWEDCAAPLIQLELLGWEPWYDFSRRYSLSLKPEFVQEVHRLSHGNHSLLFQLLRPKV